MPNTSVNTDAYNFSSVRATCIANTRFIYKHGQFENIMSTIRKKRLICGRHKIPLIILLATLIFFDDAHFIDEDTP